MYGENEIEFHAGTYRAEWIEADGIARESGKAANTARRKAREALNKRRRLHHLSGLITALAIILGALIGVGASWGLLGVWLATPLWATITVAVIVGAAASILSLYISGRLYSYRSRRLFNEERRETTRAEELERRSRTARARANEKARYAFY